MKKLLLITVLLIFALLILAVAGGTYIESTRLKEWAQTDPEGYAQAMREQQREKIAKEVERLMEARLDIERRKWEQERAEAERAEEQAQATSSGYDWQLKSKDGHPVAVGATKDAYKRYIQLLEANDAVGVLDLKMKGLVYMVPSGTPVVRIGGLVTSEVRIMDGEHAGKLGWVDVTMVKSGR